MLRICVSVLALAGCTALGVGPYQPGRMAVSGYADEAKAEKVADYGGGTTKPYYVDSSFYTGLKLGASWTRVGDAELTSAEFLEYHGGFGTSLAGDLLVLQGNLFLAGYGAGQRSNASRYSTLGAELVAKLKVTSNAALVLSPGLTRGDLTKVEMTGKQKQTGVLGIRGAVGLDYAFWHFAFGSKYSSNDIVLTVEYQRVRTGDATFGAAKEHLDGHAVALSLTLAAF